MSRWPGRGIALLVAGTFFMENLDGTILVTAAPRMAGSLGVAPADMNVAMTAYLVTLAVGIPASGWLTERWGARPVFGLAIAVFTVASGLCALSPDLPVLTAMRVVQGLGGAMMVPVGRLVVLRTTDRRDLITAIAYLTWPGLVAPVLAPVLGGLLVTYLSWHWIFLVNLPLGVVALCLALRMVPAAERAADPVRLDWGGFALIGTGLAAVVLGMEYLTDGGARWGVAATALGLGLLTAAVRHLRRTPHPLLDLGVLGVRTYRAATFSGSLFRTVVSAAPFLLPLLFQDAFGWSPLRTGLVVMAVFVGNIGIKPFTTPLMRRFGFRPVLLGSTAGLAASFIGCALLTPATPLGITALTLLASGVFRSTGFTAYNSLQFADVGRAGLAGANTLAATLQQLAAGLGVAVGALVLRLSTPLVHAVVGAGAGGAESYEVAFLVMAALACLSGLEPLRLPADAGASLSGAR
ncbi:MFS transporter [Actinacidiphila oryziradicis]|uniref:MFS transporter n=1 Tax=Actinacidiphila oryziradicis TaxID=2571141 RepID=UPI0023F0C673|nr:MFS transporter [Actinacidiphila oryziradicis]MCW2875329.1 major facilitator superfamily 1 [Actinacidiphila oryziradicis]